MVPQRHGPDQESGLAPLRLIVAIHIAFEVTFLSIRASRLVVDNLLRWYQQGGNGIDKSGFAGADITGEQSVIAVKIKAPNLLVKRSPVVHFEAAQAKTGAFAGPAFIQELGRKHCIRIFQCCSLFLQLGSDHDTPPAGGQTLPTIVHQCRLLKSGTLRTALLLREDGAKSPARSPCEYRCRCDQPAAPRSWCPART